MNEINIVFDGSKILAWGFPDAVAETMRQAGLDVMNVWEDIVSDALPVRCLCQYLPHVGDIK